MDGAWKFHLLGIPVFDLDKSLEGYEPLHGAQFQLEYLKGQPNGFRS